MNASFTIPFAPAAPSIPPGKTASGFDLDAIQRLTRRLEARDGDTHRHSTRVAWLAVRLGQALEGEPALLEFLHWAGRLHDVGKVALPPSILTKPGPLTPVETALMREHPALGCELLQPLPHFAPLLPAIRHHHENYDGTGYPDGLRGTAIPLPARVLRIADAFDAMTSQRPYRAALSVDQALEELRRGAGTDTDPALTEEFLRLIEVLRRSHPREFARWLAPPLRNPAAPWLRVVHPEPEAQPVA